MNLPTTITPYLLNDLIDLNLPRVDQVKASAVLAGCRSLPTPDLESSILEAAKALTFPLDDELAVPIRITMVGMALQLRWRRHRTAPSIA